MRVATTTLQEVVRMTKKFKVTVIISIIVVLVLTIIGIAATTKKEADNDESSELVIYKYRETDKFKTIAD